MTGQLTILNCGAGDIVVTFDNTNADDTEKAVRMLRDLLKRGFMVAVQLDDGSYTRAVDIDEKHGRYIVVVPDDLAPPVDAEPVSPKSKRRRITVPVQTSRAIGVARSAGG